MKAAVQQIMIGSITNHRKQAEETLAEIKKTGYDGLELNSFMIHKSSFLVRFLTRIAGMPTGRGGNLDWCELIHISRLEVPSIHYDLGTLEKNLGGVLEELRGFSARYAVITGMYRFDYSSKEEVTQLCDRMNAVGKRLADNGFSLLYHNHNAEWKRIESGEPAYQFLIEHTNPAYVNFEFDSYWPAEAGVNVLRVMDQLGRRMKLYHVNDRGNRVRGTLWTPIMKSGGMELGTGTMDLPALLQKAKDNGVETVILETHGDFIDRSPMESLKMSRSYLKSHL